MDRICWWFSRPAYILWAGTDWTVLLVVCKWGVPVYIYGHNTTCYVCIYGQALMGQCCSPYINRQHITCPHMPVYEQALTVFIQALPVHKQALIICKQSLPLYNRCVDKWVPWGLFAVFIQACLFSY